LLLTIVLTMSILVKPDWKTFCDTLSSQSGMGMGMGTGIGIHGNAITIVCYSIYTGNTAIIVDTV
jgi:hypothetical protein